LAAAYSAGLGRAAIAVTQDFQSRGFPLAEALHGEQQRIFFGFSIQHAAHGIALIRPEMQQAFAVIGRDRVMGNGQIEDRLSIFKDQSGGGFGQKVFEGAQEGFGLHEVFAAD
jgi:hypothetical protein